MSSIRVALRWPLHSYYRVSATAQNCSCQLLSFAVFNEEGEQTQEKVDKDTRF